MGFLFVQCVLVMSCVFTFASGVGVRGGGLFPMVFLLFVYKDGQDVQHLSAHIRDERPTVVCKRMTAIQVRSCLLENPLKNSFWVPAAFQRCHKAVPRRLHQK